MERVIVPLDIPDYNSHSMTSERNHRNLNFKKKFVMKILFQYNKSKKICSNAQEAINFIESQRTYNQAWLGSSCSDRSLKVDTGHLKLLEKMFSKEWEFECDGLPIIDANTKGRVYIKGVDYTHIFCIYRSGDFLKPEGRYSERIYIYKPLADTIEEHEEIYKANPKGIYNVYRRTLDRRRQRRNNL